MELENSIPLLLRSPFCLRQGVGWYPLFLSGKWVCELFCRTPSTVPPSVKAKGCPCVVEGLIDELRYSTLSVVVIVFFLNLNLDKDG